MSDTGSDDETTATKRTPGPGKQKGGWREKMLPPFHPAGLAGYRISTFIYKLLKSVASDIGLSLKAMTLFNSMAVDLVRRIADEAQALCFKDNKVTIGVLSVTLASKFIVSGQTHAEAHAFANEHTTKGKLGRTGLNFPVGRVWRHLKTTLTGYRITQNTAIYVTAFTEAVMKKLITISVALARDQKMNRVIPRHINLSLRQHAELTKVFPGLIPGGGVVPHIHDILLPHKKQQATIEAAAAAAAAGPPPQPEVPLPTHLQFLNPPISSFTTHEQFRARFAFLARKLMVENILYINGVEHNILEIEFYLQTANHDDGYTHCDPLQKETGHWYFHKIGKSYKGGAFKGLDFTFGDGISFGGCLIRAIQESYSLEVIEGPSLLVDHILRSNKAGSIDGLVNQPGWSFNIGQNQKILTLRPRQMAQGNDGNKLVGSPRVGLTLKSGPNFERQKPFTMALYRFTRVPSRLTKHPAHDILGLLAAGMDVNTIAAGCRTPMAKIQEYSDLLQKAKASMQTMDSFKGATMSSPAELAAALGASIRTGYVIPPITM